MNKFILLHIFVLIFSPWLWVMMQRNPLIGSLVFILSVIVFIYFRQIKTKKLFLLLLILNIILVLFVMKEASSKSIFRNSDLDIQQYNRRHEFYASDLGKIYTNRFSLTYFKDYSFKFSKLQRNFFANLDPNLYFFSSHPRERAGIEEFKKYSPFFLPFFLVGVFYLIYILQLEIMVYFLFTALVSSIISPAFNLGPILFFPLISYVISLGIMLGLKGIGRYKK